MQKGPAGPLVHDIPVMASGSGFEAGQRSL